MPSPARQPADPADPDTGPLTGPSGQLPPVPRTVTTADGLALAVFEQGSPKRPTVLLIHGYPDTHRVWDEVAACLAAEHHVVRYDMRGAGASEQPAGLAGYGLDALAEDLFAVADATSPGRAVHVVAHDWGSIGAWEAVTDGAGSHRIASFTSLSGPSLDHAGHWARARLRRPTPAGLAQLMGQAARSWYVPALQLPRVGPVLAGRGRDAAARADAVRGIALYRANMRTRLRRPRRRPTRVPVQLITLTRDRYVSPALADALTEWAPRVWRRTLTAGHWSVLSEGGPALARMVAEFVAHHEGAPAAPPLERARRRRPAGAGEPFAGRLVLVTGAGDGIGRATALAFAARGADLALCDIDLATARRTAAHAASFGVRARAWRVDVSDGPAVDAFAGEVCAALGVPDIVVNNAGVGHAGSFLQTTPQEWRRVLDVNLWGVIHGCRAFGALLAGRGEGGHIVNLASAAAYVPSVSLAAYATSKAAVVTLSDCLRAELAASGVGVSCVCPGFVDTGITGRTTFSGISGVDPVEEAARRRRAAALYTRRGFPPEKVAEQILRAVSGNRALAPVTPEARAGHLLARLSPATLRRVARIRLR